MDFFFFCLVTLRVVAEDTELAKLHNCSQVLRVLDSYGSNRGPRFSSQHHIRQLTSAHNSCSRSSGALASMGTCVHKVHMNSHRCSQLLVTQALVDPRPSSGLMGMYTCLTDTHYSHKHECFKIEE